MAIKSVFFDFDEVVRTWEHEFDGLSDYSGIPLDTFVEIAFDPLRYEVAIRGKELAESWWTEIARVLGERFPARNVEQAMQYLAGRNGELVQGWWNSSRPAKLRLRLPCFPTPLLDFTRHQNSCRYWRKYQRHRRVLSSDSQRSHRCCAVRNFGRHKFSSNRSFR